MGKALTPFPYPMPPLLSPSTARLQCVGDCGVSGFPIKQQEITNVHKDVKKRGPFYFVDGNENSWKTVWRFLKKLKMELPFDPATPLLGIYPKSMKSLS